MANTISLKEVQSVNKQFQLRTTPTNNAGDSMFNVLLGNFINVSQSFKGMVIGDFVKGREDGIYIGQNLRITKDGIIKKYVIIDGGLDTRLNLTRTNPIDIIDGVNYNQYGYALPINQNFNWGRPIVDGGLLEDIS